MEIGITFHGGPLDRIEAKTNSLDEIKLFFDERHRQVHCYRRLFEGVYTFDSERSRGLTDIYDEAKAKLMHNGTRVRFSDDPTPLPDDQIPNPAPERPLREKGKWSDKQIKDEPTPGDLLT